MNQAVGYVCRRGGGHAVMFGDPDDCCGSKAVADIVIVPRPGHDVSGVDFAQVAEDLEAKVGEAWALLDKKHWDDYEGTKRAAEIREGQA